MICEECNGKGGIYGYTRQVDGASMTGMERFTAAGRAGLTGNGRQTSRRILRNCFACGGTGEVMTILFAKEVAKKLRITTVTLRKMTNQGKLNAYRMNSRVVYREEEVERYLENLEVYATK